jgi:hypothetical protein
MKKAETIISHLLDKPTFQNAKKAYCFNKLIAALPKNLTQYIAFCYVKNDILFLAITHPGVKMELYYKSNLLKTILTLLQKSEPQCNFIQFNQIKIFVTNKSREKPQEDTVPRYREHGNGEFENLAKSEDIQMHFEAIREEIIKNKDD